MSLPFEIRHLEVVDAVDRLGSITAAAEHLRLSQPAVSHSIKQLESRLGTALFVRHPRGLDATPAGERMVKSARRVLLELRSAEVEVAEDGLGQAGTLRLTTECYTCYYWLPAVLTDLQAVMPRLRLIVSAEATRRPVEALLEDEVDVAILHRRTAHPELELTPLFTDELVALVPPDHELAAKPFLVAEDFAGVGVVLHSEPHESVLFTDLLLPAGVEPKQVWELQLTEAVLEMAKAGLGVSVMARWAAAPQISAGSLVAVPLTEQGITRTWWACRKRICASHAGCEEMVRLLREHGGRLVAGRKIAAR